MAFFDGYCRGDTASGVRNVAITRRHHTHLHYLCGYASIYLFVVRGNCETTNTMLLFFFIFSMSSVFRVKKTAIYANFSTFFENPLYKPKSIWYNIFGKSITLVVN